jgi:hypothetical protein
MMDVIGQGALQKHFSQIQGKDFQENHAPVVSDTTLHLIMVIKTMMKLTI